MSEQDSTCGNEAEHPYLSELLFEGHQIEISGLLPLRHNFQKLMKDLILRHWLVL